jgi:hypothetical protein
MTDERIAELEKLCADSRHWNATHLEFELILRKAAALPEALVEIRRLREQNTVLLQQTALESAVKE